MSKDTSERAGAAPYTHSIAGCLEGAIGRYGLTAAELGRWLDPLGPAIAALQEDYRTRALPHLRIAEETADLVGGRGGARPALAGRRHHRVLRHRRLEPRRPDLGPARRLAHPRHGERGAAQAAAHALLRQSRPVTLEAALGSFDLADTRFIVISKSGGTPETLVQALAALGAVKAAGLEKRAPELFLGITEPAVPGKANGLRTLFEAHAIPILDHHPGIGGRYSVFTNVGLIAAMARGLDARAVRAGARDVVEALMAAKTPTRFRAGRGCRHRRRPGARARHPRPGDDALFRPAGPVRGVVCAAVGREPRQGRAGHRADRLPRPRRPAQPAAALHGRAARAPDQHRAGAVGGAGPAPVGASWRRRPGSTIWPAGRPATWWRRRPWRCRRR